jgi:hypothetical protein
LERLQKVRELINNFRYPSSQEGTADLLQRVLGTKTTDPSSSLLPIVNEFDEKRWGGESSYPVSSELVNLSAFEV